MKLVHGTLFPLVLFFYKNIKGPILLHLETFQLTKQAEDQMFERELNSVKQAIRDMDETILKQADLKKTSAEAEAKIHELQVMREAAAAKAKAEQEDQELKWRSAAEAESAEAAPAAAEAESPAAEAESPAAEAKAEK